MKNYIIYIIYMKYQSDKRIIVKTVVYRFIAILLTLFFSFVFTRNLFKSIGIAVFTELFQTFVYFLYEKYWNNLDYGIYWGTKPKEI